MSVVTVDLLGVEESDFPVESAVPELAIEDVSPPISKSTPPFGFIVEEGATILDHAPPVRVNRFSFAACLAALIDFAAIRQLVAIVVFHELRGT